MKNSGFNLSLVFPALLCAALLAFAAGVWVKDSSNNTGQTVTEYTFENNNQLSDVSSNTQSEQTENITAAAESQATGSVISEFLSPYSKPSFNNIYINNKSSTAIDIKSILNVKHGVKIEKNTDPQVLIVHTHTTECYLPETRDFLVGSDVSRTYDQNYNVTAVGDVISDTLNAAGINTLHDETVHDATYTGSYSRSAATVKKYLEQYPSLKLVIDVHRDSVSSGTNDKVKPLKNINGKDCAQVMLVMGCGSTIEGFDNWQQNLSFAFKFQQTGEVMYPGLFRATTFLDAQYNQNLKTAYLLLEVGTDANSIEEAKNGASLAADSLKAYLNTLV